MPKLPRGFLEEMPGGFRGWHGSPHTFDRFDYSKIGTGEGGDKLGHGLYFGGVRPTGEYYRDLLAPGTGRLYETRINTPPASLLDLEAPLPTRGPIADAFADLPETARRPGMQMGPGQFLDRDSKGNWYMTLPGGQKVKLQRSDLDILAPEKNLTGGEAYRSLARQLGSPSAASAALNERGVPGLKSLDQVARGGAPAGSQNAVMFSDKLIDILKRYGLIAPVAGGAAMTGTWGDSAQAAPMPMTGLLPQGGGILDDQRRWWGP